MKLLLASVCALAVLSSLTPASAQPGVAPAGPAPTYEYPQSSPYQRQGLTLGGGFAVGGMSDDAGPIECADCDYNPASFGFFFHIGGYVQPRIALLFEVWASLQQLDRSATEYLNQALVTVAGQYWLTPRFWAKAGVGVAHLSLSFETYNGSDQVDLDEGRAIFVAAGYEVVQWQTVALDLQARLGSGIYDAGNIDTAMVGLGLAWF